MTARCPDCGGQVVKAGPNDDKCTQCGKHFVELSASIKPLGSLFAKGTRPGFKSGKRKRPFIEIFTGASRSADGTYAFRETVADRVRDIWREVVVLASGRRVVDKTESLKDHLGHGSDKPKS